jgi:tetratricopeptide (TPR) repeat protein
MLALIVLLSSSDASAGILFADDDAAIGSALTTYDAKIAFSYPGNDTELLARAREACAKGIDAEVALKTQVAVGLFEEAVELFAKANVAVKDIQEVAKCHLELGVAWSDAGNEEKAAAAFERALIFDPALVVDQKVHAPAIVRLFGKTKRKIEDKKLGALTIEGDPAQADVYIDGRWSGVLPMSVSGLTPGEHWLSVRAPNRIPFFSRVIVLATSMQSVRVFLQETQATQNGSALWALRKAAKPSDEESEAIANVAKNLHVAELWGLWRTKGGFAARSFTVASGRRGDLVAVHSLETFIGSLKAQRPLPEPPTQPKLPSKSAPVIEPSSQLALASRAAPASTPSVATLPMPVLTAAPRLRVHPALAWLPLGIGQFLERRPVVGVLLLVSQVLLLATNVSSYAVIRSQQVGVDTYRSKPLVDALMIVTNVSFGVLAADIIAGGIDGLVYR